MINKDKAIDAARGLTVLVMPAVHTVMLYGKPEVHHSWLSFILIFFAEGPGAQLFMFLMGFFICLGKPKSSKLIIKRSLLLFIAGYILNLARAVIPLQFSLLPPDFLANYNAYPGLQQELVLLLTGDILQMAGMAYGVVSCIRRVNRSILLSLVLYTVIAFTSPFIWNIRSSWLPADHLLALCCSGDSRAFFPLFPWLCYPLAGFVAAHLYQSIDRQAYYKRTGLYGLIIFISGCLIYQFTPKVWEWDFYRSSPGRTIYQTGFVMLWICIIHFLVTRFSAKPFFRLLSFCSRHITNIYFIQWIIICWSISIAGYHRLDLIASLIAMFITSMITFSITFLIARLQNKT